MKNLTGLFLIALAAACSDNDGSTDASRAPSQTGDQRSPERASLPDWLQALVTGYESGPASGSPGAVWGYSFKGQTVYYIPARCCDRFAELYDERGTALCAPDGGLTGKGDGKCPDFESERTNEHLIWDDPRPEAPPPH